MELREQLQTVVWHRGVGAHEAESCDTCHSFQILKTTSINQYCGVLCHRSLENFSYSVFSKISHLTNLHLVTLLGLYHTICIA